jgi:hypothetical protein
VAKAMTVVAVAVPLWKASTCARTKNSNFHNTKPKNKGLNDTGIKVFRQKKGALFDPLFLNSLKMTPNG